MDKIPGIFEQLSYGPAPESDAAVNSWFAAHDSKFGHFIGNKWVHPEGRDYIASICPANKETIAETIQGTQADVDLAVKSARTAFDTWSKLPGFERAKHLYAIARHLQKHHRLLAVLESLDNGKSHRESRDADVPLIVRHFYHHAGWAQVMKDEMPGYKPIGVIGQIIPWNFPLLMLAWKIAPALAMGNTVVLKPATNTRLSALCFAQICAEAGVPEGVINVITGGGRMGSMLVDHPDVDKVAFTGSTDIGRLLRRRIAGTGKKISLELGGKSPVVVFDTADLDSAIEGCVDAIWFNQGQVCCAGSRLLIQENVADKFIGRLKQRMDRLRLGHPLDKCIDMGPLVDQSQYDSVRQYMDIAKNEGASVYSANIEVPEGGYYVAPTIVYDVSNSSRCVREEIFGPVLTVQTFRTPEEAIALANNTPFGLGGSVWSENVSLAIEVALSIKAGVVWVNCHNRFDAAAGFGGYKESGFGREGGKEGLYEYAKPDWATRPRPDVKFPIDGATWANPAPGVPAKLQDEVAAGTRTGIDKTAKMYVGGKQCRPDGNYYYPVVNPKTKEIVGQAGEGNRKDIREAVEAAWKAGPGWGKRAAYNRAQICFYLAENLDYRRDEFAARIQAQTGRDEADCKKEVELSISRLFYYAAYADKYGGNVQETTLYGVTASVNEPVGVIAIACPDEYPLLGFVSLFAPAIVRGNVVVIVPSPVAPLTATDLYQVFETSDVPAGVVNIVTGQRDLLSKTLAEHQNIDAMWYFGSAEGSANVEYAASENMKRTWVNYGQTRDWMSDQQGQGIEFLRESVEVKNVWIPMGEVK